MKTGTGRGWEGQNYKCYMAKSRKKSKGVNSLTGSKNGFDEHANALKPKNGGKTRLQVNNSNQVERAKKESGVSRLLFQNNHSARKLKLTTNLSLLTDEKCSFLEKYVPSSYLN